MLAEFVDVVDDLAFEVVGTAVLGLCQGVLRPALLVLADIRGGSRQKRSREESGGSGLIWRESARPNNPLYPAPDRGLQCRRVRNQFTHKMHVMCSTRCLRRVGAGSATMNQIADRGLGQQHVSSRYRLGWYLTPSSPSKSES